MIVCPQCHKEFPDQTRFCDQCGIALTNDSKKSKSKTNIKKLSGKKWILIVVAIVLVVAIITGAFFIFPREKRLNYALYLKDNEIFYTDFSNKDPWQVTSNFFYNSSFLSDSEISYMSQNAASFITVSQNEKYIFFCDKIDDESGVPLYYRRLGKKDEAVKIASNVTNYYVTANSSTVIYSTSDGGIYEYDLKSEDKNKLASDISTWYISKDLKTIVYLTKDSDAYFLPIGKEKEKIDSDVSSICKISDDKRTVYYLRDDVLYKKSIGSDKTKISSDVYNVTNIYDSGEMYYYKLEEVELPLANYVEDDMASTDATMQEPQSPSYPSWFDYDSDEEYEAAYDKYEEEYEAYQEAYDEYRNKDNRDELRDDIANMTMTVNKYSYFYYDGKKESKLGEATNVSYVTSSSDTAVLAYMSNDANTIEKTKFSDIDDFYNVESSIESNVREAFSNSSVLNVAVGSTVSTIEQNDASSIQISDDGSVIYFLDSEAEDNEVEETTGNSNSYEYDYSDDYSSTPSKNLYRVSLSGGKAQKPVLYDTDLTYYSFDLTADGKVLYFKEVNSNSSKGDLYIDKEKVDFDVNLYNYAYIEETKEIIYFTDVSDGEGSLKIYDGNAEKIADNVSVDNVSLTPDNELLYIGDYSDSGRGDLYIYDGKSTRIDTDVSVIIPVYQR